MALVDRIEECLSGSEADGGGVVYECTSCGTTFDAAREECPECGGTDVRERGGPAGPDVEGPNTEI